MGSLNLHCLSKSNPIYCWRSIILDRQHFFQYGLGLLKIKDVEILSSCLFDLGDFVAQLLTERHARPLCLGRLRRRRQRFDRCQQYHPEFMWIDSSQQPGQPREVARRKPGDQKVNRATEVALALFGCPDASLSSAVRFAGGDHCCFAPPRATRSISGNIRSALTLSTLPTPISGDSR